MRWQTQALLPGSAQESATHAAKKMMMVAIFAILACRQHSGRKLQGDRATHQHV